MAAIASDRAIDLAALRAHLVARLPDYARPLFVRIRGEIEMTTTFKQKKIDLVKQGFDPKATEDAIYFNDPQTRAFVRLDSALYSRILAGEVKLSGIREEPTPVASAPVTPRPADVLSFWRFAGPEKWFNKDDALDADIRERFLPRYESAAAGAPCRVGDTRRRCICADSPARPISTQYVSRQRARIRDRRHGARRGRAGNCEGI